MRRPALLFLVPLLAGCPSAPGASGPDVAAGSSGGGGAGGGGAAGASMTHGGASGTAHGGGGGGFAAGAAGKAGHAGTASGMSGASGGAAGGAGAGVAGAFGGGAGGSGGALASGGTGGAAGAAGGAASARPFVFVGSGKGNIHVFAMSESDGSLSAAGAPVNFGNNPSFLSVDPARALLFAVDEAYPGGQVASFAVKAGAELSLVSTRPAAAGPVFVRTDGSGKFLLVPNYGSGEAMVFPVGDSGALGAPADVAPQGASANPHLFVTDPANKFAFVPDKGADRVAQYAFDAATGKLSPNAVASFTTPPGSGPRHLDFHPGGAFAYLVEELSLTVEALAYDAATGRLSSLQSISTLAPGHAMKSGDSAAEIFVAPSGGFVYASNRLGGDSDLVVYAVGADGRLSMVDHTPSGGSTPRSFAVDPKGGFLLVADLDSDAIVRFAIDPATGKLTPGATTAVPSPQFVGVAYLVLP